MPKPASIFESLSVKVDRAEQHICDLEREILSFKASDPYKITPENNPETGQRTWRIHFLKNVPLPFSAIIGDAVQNMRSALDHLATHLVEIGPGPDKVRFAYFPAFPSSEEYHAEKLGKIGGAGKDAIKAIDAVEPYRRGHGWAIYDLAKINNRDKHTLIIPAWISLTGHSFTRSDRERIGTVLKDTFPGGLPVGMLSTPNVPPTFLEDGGELHSMPITEVEDHTRFRIEIAFGEPENVRFKPIVPTLRNMLRVVRSAVKSFKDKGLI